MTMNMLKLVEGMAKALVNIPEEVRVREVRATRVTVFELRVASTDLGKVIGRQGRLADAMRNILWAAGVKERRRLHLEILE
jgi:hypothetical protein